MGSNKSTGSVSTTYSVAVDQASITSATTALNRVKAASNSVTASTKVATKAGDMHTRASRKGTMAMLELSRGVEDATVVWGTQGLTGAVRASANNFSQLFSVLSPGLGVIAGFSAALGSVLIPALFDTQNAAKKAKEELKEFIEAQGKVRQIGVKQALDLAGGGLKEKKMNELFEAKKKEIMLAEKGRDLDRQALRALSKIKEEYKRIVEEASGSKNIVREVFEKGVPAINKLRKEYMGLTGAELPKAVTIIEKFMGGETALLEITKEVNDSYKKRTALLNGLSQQRKLIAQEVRVPGRPGAIAPKPTPQMSSELRTSLLTIESAAMRILDPLKGKINALKAARDKQLEIINDDSILGKEKNKLIKLVNAAYRKQLSGLAAVAPKPPTGNALIKFFLGQDTKEISELQGLKSLLSRGIRPITPKPSIQAESISTVSGQKQFLDAIHAGMKDKKSEDTETLKAIKIIDTEIKRLIEQQNDLIKENILNLVEID